jgi:beta-fructofuranosidase
MSKKLNNKLVQARSFEIEANKTKIDRPFFHLTPPTGWMNDPNGFSIFKDKIHLFFQYNPYSTEWGPMHWGHVITKDFVTWEYLPTALAPDSEYDSFGCFSGTAIEYNNKHLIAYTGVETIIEDNGDKKEIQRQCISIGDGLNYEKCEFNPIITEKDLPEGSNKYDFRDPKIWIEEDTFFMAIASRNSDNSGQILIYSSIDLKHWNFISILDKCNKRYGEIWECPDLFHLDDSDFILTSPQNMKAVKTNMYEQFGTIYISGELDKSTYTFEEKIIESIDLGFDFYAPQTILNKDGRRIMIAWMQSWTNPLFDSNDGFCGMMTFPRELTSQNGKLIQKPVKEIENYYTKSKLFFNLKVFQTLTKYDKLSSRLMDMEIFLNYEKNCTFEIRLAANETVFTSFIFNSNESTITFDRSKSSIKQSSYNIREIKLPENETTLKMRFLMDKYSIELFINDGKLASTNIIKTPIDIDGIYMRSVGNIEIDVKQHLLENFNT